MKGPPSKYLPLQNVEVFHNTIPQGLLPSGAEIFGTPELEKAKPKAECLVSIPSDKVLIFADFMQMMITLVSRRVFPV